MTTFFPMADTSHPDRSIEDAATRLATLLTSGGGGLRDSSGGDLEFEPGLALHPLARRSAPAEVWAVDGGQALVADAKCLQVYVTKAARVCWSGGRMVLEEEGPLRAHLLGLGEERRALAALGAPVAADCAVDVNLLRDWGEWSAVSACVRDSSPGAVVLVDGDLQPDWRIPAAWLAGLLEEAASREVVLVGITKHTSLSWGGGPLIGHLERLAASDPALEPGGRACWWVPIARTRPDVGPGLQVVAARLDPDARFAFRVDLPGQVDPEVVLGALSAISDDAAFPGYPYPLSVADRLASCPHWVRDEVWGRMDEVFDRAGVSLEVRERAFDDRHRLMERY